jgi:hypothetical protein
MLSVFYALQNSLTDTLRLLSLMQSSPAVAWVQLPMVAVPLPLIPKLSPASATSFSQQQNPSSYLTHSLTNQLIGQPIIIAGLR